MRRAPRAVLLGLLAVAALGGCGKSQDEKLFDERRRLCSDLAARGATMREAITTLSPQHYCSPFSTASVTFSKPADGSLDGCPFDADGFLTEPLVQEWFEWHAVDDSLCSGSACSYYCVVYYPGTAPALDTPICGARFFSRDFPRCFF